MVVYAPGIATHAHQKSLQIRVLIEGFPAAPMRAHVLRLLGWNLLKLEMFWNTVV